MEEEPLHKPFIQSEIIAVYTLDGNTDLSVFEGKAQLEKLFNPSRIPAPSTYYIEEHDDSGFTEETDFPCLAEAINYLKSKGYVPVWQIGDLT
ncbi:hypothetical protein AGMMS49975_15660 [Clostridia bacterium]|nr:hypothetical protein AGMMS49975_15660 [Clostridia bacterium]